MKIKHWQGYGSVEATKLRKSASKVTGLTTLVIKVKGNHEYGIERNDKYDVARWLVNRFDRNFKNTSDYRAITSLNLNSYTEDGIDVCNYTIVYKTPDRAS